MDFKGFLSTGDGGRGDPFTITDAHSCYLIRHQILSRMDLSQVRAVCKAAMRGCGCDATPGPAEISSRKMGSAATSNSIFRSKADHGNDRVWKAWKADYTAMWIAAANTRNGIGASS
jgi:hypothetical protein